MGLLFNLTKLSSFIFIFSSYICLGSSFSSSSSSNVTSVFNNLKLERSIKKSFDLNFSNSLSLFSDVSISFLFLFVISLYSSSENWIIESLLFLYLLYTSC